MPNVLLRCVTQSGYSVGFKSGVISQELDGGAPRYRRVIKNAYHNVNVQWVVKEAGFDYLDALHNVWCENPNEFCFSTAQQAPQASEKTIPRSCKTLHLFTQLNVHFIILCHPSTSSAVVLCAGI